MFNPSELKTPLLSAKTRQETSGYEGLEENVAKPAHCGHVNTHTSKDYCKVCENELGILVASLETRLKTV